MRKVVEVVKRYGGVLPALAMVLAIASVTQACFFWYNQPDIPKSLMRTEED
jgi:cyclic lactone autoinducer peptide